MSKKIILYQKYRKTITALCPILAGILAHPALAQSSAPINTERPSFSSSPLALGKGLWQIESGYLYARDENTQSLKESTLPNLLLRYGFYENFELQLAGTGYTSQTIDSVKQTGTQDASLGVKWQISPGDSSVPLALFGGVSLPTGSDKFSSDEYAPTLSLFWSHSGSLNWFGTASLNFSDEIFNLDNAIGLSFSLDEETGLFVEYLGSFSENSTTEDAHTLNTGLTRLLSNNIQLDINGSLGINQAANDYTAGIGLSYRIQ